MKEKTKNLLNFISLILNAAGVKLNEKDKKILFSKKSSEELKSLSDEQKKSLGKFYDNLFEGYILLAIKGYEFTNIDRIKEKFGLTLEENYPEASKSFIKFARTYWTFQVHLLEDFTGLTDYLAYLYLADLHAKIASIFFPTQVQLLFQAIKEKRLKKRYLKILILI